MVALARHDKVSRETGPVRCHRRLPGTGLAVVLGRNPHLGTGPFITMAGFPQQRIPPPVVTPRRCRSTAHADQGEGGGWCGPWFPARASPPGRGPESGRPFRPPRPWPVQRRPGAPVPHRSHRPIPGSRRSGQQHRAETGNVWAAAFYAYRERGLIIECFGPLSQAGFSASRDLRDWKNPKNFLASKTPGRRRQPVP